MIQERLSDGLDAVAREMAEVGTLLWARGWAERNAGNLSVDVTELVPSDEPDPERRVELPGAIAQPELAGRCFFITATGARLRELADRGGRSLLLVRIEERLDGYRILWGREGTSLATSELPAHLEVHGFLRESGSPYSAVVHTHPTHLIALTQIESLAREDALNQLLWSMHPEVKVFLPEGVGFAPYRCPGSTELAAATVEALRDHRLCLWEKHGCVSVGRDVVEAFDLIDTANKAAEIYLLCRGAGYEPQGLSPEQLDELRRRFGKGSGDVGERSPSNGGARQRPRYPFRG
jgi:rhamnulose-1-phosphate aldolase